MKKLMLLTCLIGFILLIACATSTKQSTDLSSSMDTLEQISPRPGVELKYLLIKPESPPTDAVILFAGDHGNLDLGGSHDHPTIGYGQNNFLVRTRKLFADHGFVVAVPSLPSDKKTHNVRKAGVYRLSKAHVVDITAVINKLKKDYNVPVWLVGTSIGTASAAWLSANMKNNISGLVLTGSITNFSSIKNPLLPHGILDLPLNEISVPTLVVSNEKDGCKFTPPSGDAAIKSALTGAPIVKVEMISGGIRSFSNPCKGLSLHGFYGKEKETVNDIAQFIKMN